jgi:hypothetical protein
MDILDEFFPRPKQKQHRQLAQTKTWRDRVASGAVETIKPTTARNKQTKRVANLGKTGERWCKQYLPQVCGGHLEKSRVVERGGYFISTDVDFVGSIPLAATVYPVHVEAKAWSTGNFALSQISERERGFLKKARRNRDGALLCIVRFAHQKEHAYRLSDAICAYLIPWARWLEIEQELSARAGGRFRGRSLREQDLGLVADCKIERVSGRWELCGDHWLRPLLPQQDNQAALPF